VCSRLKFSGEPMCEECKELDEAISHYQRLATFPYTPPHRGTHHGVMADLQQKRDAMQCYRSTIQS
jgi:hypothetical protein